MGWVTSFIDVRRILELGKALDAPLKYALLLREIVFLWVVLEACKSAASHLWGYGLIETIRRLWVDIGRRAFHLFLQLPPIKKKVDYEVNQTITKIHDSIIVNDEELLQFPILPQDGLPIVEVTEQLDKLQLLKHTDWSNGRVSGAVYHGGDELIQLQTDAYHKYAVANQLHPDVFPGVRKMESEVVSMVLNIFNAPASGQGTTTSGGTESLLLAGLSAREYGKKYKGIHKPEVIAPITVHAGIEKACTYFGMKLHKVEVDPITFKVDLRKVRRLINGNTVLLVGSAPNFPHGIIDDIEGLSKLAVKYNIPLHVDACLGSFIVSFLEQSKVHGDRKLPLFDFRVPGVTSISCDTHKYGFAPKGSSIIMYRNSKLRECQYYVSIDWTGGMYGSPTLAGSRPGALMVGCWATLVSIGKTGYAAHCKDIVGSAMEVKKEFKTNPKLSKYLEILGDPIALVISFKVKKEFTLVINVYELGDCLTTRGWHFSALQNPSALHFAFTKLSVGILETMTESLISSLDELIAKSDAQIKSGLKKVESDTAAFYGVAGSVKTTGVAEQVIVGFIDGLYKVQ